MEEILSSVDDHIFDVEIALENQIGALPLPFPGMDKSLAAVCVFHLRGCCERGSSCPYRHIKADRTIVCKHWLRGLCKKGDQCEFLHEYDMSKMPECFFYMHFNACSNKDCPFLHIDPESKIKDCPWYDRGFCRHGPNCRHRHTRRIVCLNYLTGFCPLGPDCKQVHPRFDLPSMDSNERSKKGVVVCHFCGEAGHKIYNCPKMPAEDQEHSAAPRAQEFNRFDRGERFQNDRRKEGYNNNNNNNNNNNSNSINNSNNNNNNINNINNISNTNNNSNRLEVAGEKPRIDRQRRPLDQVTCYKCGERGHYANKCPKGHLAFLSSALKGLQGNQGNQRPPNSVTSNGGN